jgi:DNA-binding Lrp family transcriptional regulator
MVQANLRARILSYLEGALTGNLLRSERDIANAVSATVEEVHEMVRDLVRRGEVFEPIPRRYLRRERRIGERRGGAERRAAARLLARERRTKARRAASH